MLTSPPNAIWQQLITTNNTPLPTVWRQVIEVLQQASQLLNQQYQYYQQQQHFEIQQKQDSSPVTQADLLIDKFLSQHLTEIENIPILSEEGEHSQRLQWQRFWLIDPLDGTKEFLSQSGEFTINVSIIEHHQPILSAIAVPQKNCIYLNQAQQKPIKVVWQAHEQFIYQYQKVPVDMYANGVGKEDIPLKITMTRRPQQYILYQKWLDFLQQRNIHYQFIAAGSAYKFCLLLEGEADMYLRFHPTSEWDTAAGQGLLQGVGGGVWDLQQRPFRYNQRQQLENGSFVALADSAYWSYILQFLQTLS